MNDTGLRCADCGGELGMLVVMRGMTRLGHRRSPATLHAPRLARSAADASPAMGCEDRPPLSEEPATVPVTPVPHSSPPAQRPPGWCPHLVHASTPPSRGEAAALGSGPHNRRGGYSG